MSRKRFTITVDVDTSKERPGRQLGSLTAQAFAEDLADASGVESVTVEVRELVGLHGDDVIDRATVRGAE